MTLTEIALLLIAASAVAFATGAVLAWRRLLPLVRSTEELVREARTLLPRLEALATDMEAIVHRTRAAGDGIGRVGGALVNLVPPVRRLTGLLGVVRAGAGLFRRRAAG